MRRIVSGIGLLALLVCVEPVGAQELLLTGARVVDPAARTITESSILIRDGRIAGFPGTRPAGYSGQELDLGGRWVIPALTDMHTHSFGNAAASGPMEFLGPAGVARVDLSVGVGRFLDLFSPEDMILGLRNQQRTTGEPAGAEILAAGPCLTATRGHCSEYGVPTRIVDSPADARREIAELAVKKPDVVKLVYDHQTYSGRSMPTVDRVTMEAVVAEARKHGLKTVVHVGTWQDLREAVEAGAAAVTHTPSGPPPEGLGAFMAARGAMHIPTLAVQGDYARYVADPTLLESPLLGRAARKSLIESYGVRPDTGRLARWVGWQETLIEDNLAAVGALARAGVPMLTGTDAGNPAVFQGYSVHRELRLLVEAGLSAWDALAGSTVLPGRFFDRNWGMTEGAEASLVVLEGSPIEDIRNTERIFAIVHRGRLVSR